MNKQKEDKMLEMLPHIQEKSTEAHPLDSQKGGVEWWIQRGGGSGFVITQISYIGIDADCAEEFWLKYVHDETFPHEHLFFSFFSYSLIGVLISSLKQWGALKRVGGQVCTVFVLI